jgi:hypothetical protein
MIATDFSRAKAVCAVRYANFASDCCKSVASAPHLDYSARRADVAEGNDLGQRKRPTGSNPEPATRPRKIRPWDCPSRHKPGDGPSRRNHVTVDPRRNHVSVDPRRNHVTVHPRRKQGPMLNYGCGQKLDSGLAYAAPGRRIIPVAPTEAGTRDSLCFGRSGNPVIPVVPAEAGTQWRSWGDRNDSKDTGSPLSRG